MSEPEIPAPLSDEPQPETPTPENSERGGILRRKKPRKTRSDKGKRRGAKTSKGRPGARPKSGGNATRREKARQWLAEAEATYITHGLGFLFAARYGLQTAPPAPDKVKHLAGLLRKLEAFPPFAALQNLLGKIIPMADPDAKPGGSALGDLVQYANGWHEKNPELWKEIYLHEPVPEFPILPKAQMRAGRRTGPERAPGGGVVKIRRTIQPDEFQAASNRRGA